MEPRARLDGKLSVRLPSQLLLCVSVALLMVSPLQVTTASAEQQTKRVLVFSAHDSYLPGVVALNGALRSTIKDGSPARVEFFYEAQENTRIPIEEYEQELVAYLRQKYRGETFDLIITVGAPALKFLSSHEAELFTNTPRLFFFYDESEEVAHRHWPHTTGLWVKLDISETLEMALALHPDTKKVVVVSGSGDNNNFLRELARSDLRRYEREVEMEYPTDLTIDELKDTLASLPKQSLVLFLDFALDREGNTFSGPEALSKIAPTSSAPIYGMSNTFIGAGVVGGRVIDFQDLGRLTGEMALHILGGEQSQDISPQTATGIRVFDWKELRHWRIGEDRLPPGSIVRFRAPSVWDEYKWYLLGITSLILLQSALISGLMINRSRRRRAEGQNQILIHALGERVKESTVLHLAARILHGEGRSVPELLQDLVALLPSALQYPDVTAARIRLGDMEFETPNFAHTQWSQAVPFTVGNLDGAIEVVYLEARPDEVDGPFLLEETHVIESLAEMLGSALNRRATQEALQASEERFAKAFQASPEPISIDRHGDGTLQEVNDRWTATYGYSRDEAIGHDALDLQLVEPGVGRHLRDLLEEHAAFRNVEVELRTKHGNVRRVSLAAEQIVVNGERCDIFLHHDITERREAEEKLRASREQLRALSERLRRAKEDEGIRIARELHDGLGAALTSIRWSLMRLDRVASSDEGTGAGGSERKGIEEMVGLVDGTIRMVRRIASELRPGVLDDLGLVAAVEWHVRQFQDQTGIVCRFGSRLEIVDLSLEQAVTVFRIFQEALTNVLRHAQATEVDIIISRDDGDFVLEVTDNGRGITEAEKLGTHSLGLLGMRERAHSIGATLEIGGILGSGTTVLVRFPYEIDRAS